MTGSLDAYEAWRAGVTDPVDPPAQAAWVMDSLATDLRAAIVLIDELAAMHDRAACGCRAAKPCPFLAEARLRFGVDVEDRDP